MIWPPSLNLRCLSPRAKVLTELALNSKDTSGCDTPLNWYRPSAWYKGIMSKDVEHGITVTLIYITLAKQLLSKPAVGPPGKRADAASEFNVGHRLAQISGPC